MTKCLISLIGVLLFFQGCAYRYYAEDFKPKSEQEQGPNKTVADDGTVSFKQARLGISLRPMTDAELNRQFSAYSNEGQGACLEKFAQGAPPKISTTSSDSPT